MKNLATLLALIPFIGFAQFPITQEFNPGNDWVYTSGSGIQNYGGAENYATTNIGLTPYPNNATVTITSPVYNLSTCLWLMQVSFPLFGRIENNFDFMHFQYRIGAGAWVTVQSFTGTQNATFTYNAIPNTATQFRFLLQTDNTVNSFTTGPWWNQTVNVYYYDIARFTITCSGVMPVEFVSFKGKNSGDNNELTWFIDSETNCDYYTIERSTDDEEYSEVGKVTANGSYEYKLRDYDYLNGINYYRLSQTDNDGTLTELDVITIDNRVEAGEIVSVVNLLGQPCAIDAPGIVVVQYADGKIEKKFNN
jgi:hypothetical protein